MRNLLRRGRIAFFAAAFLLVALAAPAVRAQTLTWNGSSNDWTTGANWTGGTPGSVPGSGDTAIIGSGIVTVSTPITVGNLTLTGGALTGSGSLTIVTNLAWSGGSMTGSGSTSVNNGGSASFDTTNNSITLSQRLLTLNAQSTWIGARAFNIDTNGQISNNNNFDFQNSGGSVIFGTGGGNIFNNATIKKSTGTSTAIVSGAGAGTFNNNGTVSIQTGSLNLSCGGSNTNCTYAVAAGGSIQFGVGGATTTIDATSNVNGAGAVTFAAGTISMQGAYNVTGSTVVSGGAVTFSGSIQNLGATLAMSAGTLNLGATSNNVTTATLSGGTLMGTGTLSVSGTFTWSGGTMSGTGKTTVTATGSCTIQTNGTLLTLSGWSLNNLSGNGTWNGSTGGFFNLDTGATFNNSGIFDCQNTGGSKLQFHAGGGTINNSGVWANSTASTTAIEDMGGTGLFNNSGIVTVAAGVLTFNTAYTQVAGAEMQLSGGNVTGNTLNLQGGDIFGVGTITANVNNSAGIMAPGLAASSGVLTIAGNYTQGASGTLDIRIGGTDPSQYDQLNVTGAASLGGTLFIGTVNNFTPGAADSFTFMTFASKTGTFATVNNGTALNVLYTAVAVTLSNATAPSLAITSFVSSENPAFLNDTVTFSFSAADSTVASLTYTLDFGDGSPTATGTFAQGPSLSVNHVYVLANNNTTVTLTVADRILPPVTMTLTQMVPPPNSGGAGVTNVSTNADPVVDPLDGLGISVVASNGGVIQLGIDVSSLTRSSYSVSTVWGDVQGRGSTVVGTRPVHQYVHHGIFVADVTATNIATGARAGHARKTLTISSSETGESTAQTALQSKQPRESTQPRVTGNAPSNAITSKTLNGKFAFSGTTPDTVTYTGLIQLPPGLDTSKPYEFWFAAGNIVTTTTVKTTGVGTLPGDPAVLKSFKITYSKVKKGALTKGGEIAKVTAVLNAKGLVIAGFDTEGISPQATDVGKGMKASRSIQVSMLLDGVPYETLAPVSFALSANALFGNVQGRGSK